MYKIIFLVILVLNIPVIKKIYGLMFQSKKDVNETIKYSLTSDWISLWRGELTNDIIATSRFRLFAMISTAVIATEFTFVYLAIKIFETYN